MRYVPIGSLREGMIVAKSLYNTNNKLLVRAGYPIKRLYLDRIKSLGYQGVYIDDNISKDIEIKNIVGDELRRRTVYAVKNVFSSLKMSKVNKTKAITNNLEITKDLIDGIVMDIIANKDAMVNMVDIKVFDEYTFFHSVNVAILSMIIGAEMKLGPKAIYNLGLAGVLHDIGKVYIDKDILHKKAKLTDEEFELVKKHSEYGYKHLKSTYEIPTSSYVGVLQHHERYDGLGYPHKKIKNEISLFGRIICIADVYDAITSNRPYRKAMLPSEAMEYIMANSGLMFDDQIVKIFINKVAAYPVGSTVILSNKTKALVLSNNAGAPMRPLVRIFSENGQDLNKPYELDLGDMNISKDITIVEIYKD